MCVVVTYVLYRLISYVCSKVCHMFFVNYIIFGFL